LKNETKERLKLKTMEIKGTALLAIRDFVKLNHKDKYETWLNMLNDDSRNIFNSAIDSTLWYPVDIGAVEPTTKIGELIFMNDLKKGAWESGRYSAEKGLTGIYKIFVKASSPNFIISRAKDIFAKYYRPCQVKVVKNESKGIVLHMVDMDQGNEVVEYRIAGWIQKALEISGVNEIEVDITKSVTRGDAYTEFDIKWA
jgi:hypothetical protein